jgi:NAD+ synthase (glutamine-hydrolysing)
MTPTRVGLAQINPIVGDLGQNRRLIVTGIHEACRAGCDIVVFPELAVCGYPPEDLLLKRSFLNKCKESVDIIADEVKDIVVLLGSPWKFNWGGHRHEFNRNGEEIYNSAVVLAEQRVQDVYFKIELPNYGVFDEKRYFSRLDTPECVVFVMNGTRFCVTICEDIWIDHSPVRTLAAMNNVDVTLNLSASPFFAGKLSTSRYEALTQYCLKTSTSLVYVNNVGGQDELVFDGTSMVVDHRGKVRYMAKRFETDLLVVDLDEKFLKVGKEGYLFRDYYPSTSSIERDFAYKFEPNPNKPTNELTISEDFSETIRNQKGIEEVFNALVRGLKDYVNKNGFDKVVIGESGGIDSAVTTAIAVEALGAERVIGITMPSRITSNDTKDDACLLMDNFGILSDSIRIESLAASYDDTISYSSIWSSAVQENPVVWENIQARIRGNILMALSNQFGWLVLSTGNKSESAVGYCTLYGDMAGGFNVLKDVYKTQVYELARYVNKLRLRKNLLGIPESIITRPPTAELSEGQTDEKSLGAYSLLDPVLEAYIEKELSIADIQTWLSGTLLLHKAPDNYVRDIVLKVDRNEYKRRQGCPGVKITPKAFGKDRRMPITNGYV